MQFRYSRHVNSPQQEKLERFFEILPGALSWGIIISICLLSIFQPLFTSVLMIVFLLYWLLRLLYLNIFLVSSYARLAIEEKTNWMELINVIDHLDINPNVYFKPKKDNFKNRISTWLNLRQIKRLKAGKNPPPASKDIYHLVIMPVIREAIEIVEPGIKAIAEGEYPAQKFLVVIALEERATDEIKEQMKTLQEKYKNSFLDFLVVIHPADTPGEARVKGANASFAARKAERYFQEHKIPLENILVSCFDADTVANPHYFSCLTYYFLVMPNRLRSSFQPIPVYHNNIWDVPAFARIIDIGTSFFQLIESTDSRRLVTFSSHSMSFKALVEIDYWPVDMISDDSAIFWKAFIHYDGNYQVTPIYTKVSMDIAVGESLQKTFINIYKQKRRWAWGVENIPIVMRAFLELKSLSLRSKIGYGYKMFDSFVSWATWPFLLMLGTWLPAFFTTQEFSSSTVYYTAPRIREIIFSLSSLGLIVCMIVSLLLLPKEKPHSNWRVRLMHILEWLFIPLAVIFLSALPALDAQTRLMFAKYMEFWVAEKIRKK